MKRNFMRVVALIILMLVLICTTTVSPSAKSAFYSNATTLSIKNHIEYDAGFSLYTTAQGSCTDGKYAYFAINNGSTTILKYNVNTWELVSKKSGINLGHANDMTYNPDQNVIVVANNAPNYNTVTLIDPDSLKIISTKKLDLKIYSISYCQSRQQYVVGISGTYNFALLDKAFKVDKKYQGYKSGYTRQGSDCDNDYIYFVQSGGGGNIIVIYNWSGKVQSTVSIDKSLEIENIFHVGNTFYITLHHYGNFVYRIGISDATAIKYAVQYDSADGDGQMQDTTVLYGNTTKLSKCSFTKDGYLFGGWKIKRDSTDKWYGKKTCTSKNEWLKKDDIDEYALYKDESKVSKTTKVGNITAQAFWIAESYIVHYNENGGEGYIQPRTAEYGEEFSLDKNTMTKEGFIFVGWKAKREIDNKVFGYAKDSKKPMWIHENEMQNPYIFCDEECVTKLTYDKDVTMYAQWESAFKFSNDGAVLEKYIGKDKDVVFPENATDCTCIADNAFENVASMQTIVIPSKITTVGNNIFKGCSNLEKVYFDSSVPVNVKDDSFDTDTLADAYISLNGENVFIGWCIDKNSYAAIKGLYIEHLKQKS